jgi:hypothetical protein
MQPENFDKILKFQFYYKPFFKNFYMIYTYPIWSIFISSPNVALEFTGANWSSSVKSSLSSCVQSPTIRMWTLS